MEIINHKGKYYLKSDTGYREVLATTDKSLKIGTISQWKDDGKSHGRVEEDILLPSIPNDFLQAYVKAQGKIEKVLVEMQYAKDMLCLHGCKCAEGFQDLCENHIEGKDLCKIAVKLKLSSDNTIIIIPFEEKKQNFTREEFKQALELLYFQKGGGYEDEFNEWFDKNY